MRILRWTVVYSLNYYSRGITRKCKALIIIRHRRKVYYYAMQLLQEIQTLFSGGSRISRRGDVDPLGGRVDLLGGMHPQCGHFLAKMYAKTKELGPVGGCAPGTPSKSTNAFPYLLMASQEPIRKPCFRVNGFSFGGHQKLLDRLFLCSWISSIN